MLTHNALADMYGPDFLLLYAAVIALTLAWSGWFLSRLDTSDATSLPVVPARPDPFVIAYLRGGENEVTRVAIFDLIQRGYLEVSTEKSGRRGKAATQKLMPSVQAPNPSSLPSLEREIFSSFTPPRNASEVFKSDLPARVKLDCLAYEQTLRDDQLLSPEGQPAARANIGWKAAAVIALLGTYKFCAALANGHTNVAFLFVFGLIGLIVLVCLCRTRRLTRRGKAYLQRLQQAFQGLKRPQIGQSADDDPAVLLLSVYGVTALTGTPHAYYGQMFANASGGSCGGGCGSSGGCGSGGEAAVAEAVGEAAAVAEEAGKEGRHGGLPLPLRPRRRVECTSKPHRSGRGHKVSSMTAKPINTNPIPPLGVGLGFRSPYLGDLFLHQAQVDFLEIVTDHYLDAAPAQEAELELLAAHFPLIPHGLNLSLGSAEGLDEVYVQKITELVNRTQPPYWSEHLAFTHADGIEIGHLTPLPLTREALDIFCRNVAIVQKYTDVPLILENITQVVAFPGEMTEAQFLSELTERTNCGLLLDVTNLYTNSVNLSYDLDAFLADAPLERVVQLHFTGGHWQDGILVDSHSAPTPPEVWELMAAVVAKTPVKGIILERDENLPPFAELAEELSRARQIGQDSGRWD